MFAAETFGVEEWHFFYIVVRVVFGFENKIYDSLSIRSFENEVREVVFGMCEEEE